MIRKHTWTATVVALVLIIVAAWLLWQRESVTFDMYQAIRLGMTEAQVEEVMGGPGRSPEEVYLIEYPVTLSEGHIGRHMGKGWAKIWQSRRNAVDVYYTKDGRVGSKGFSDNLPRPTLLDRVIDWIG